MALIRKISERYQSLEEDGKQSKRQQKYRKNKTPKERSVVMENHERLIGMPPAINSHFVQ